MQKIRINKELKRSQLLIATLFSIFLFLILEITWSLFYFWIPTIEKYFFEKELDILSENYKERINQKTINREKDIEKIKIWDYFVLLDKEDKNNFLVQKWENNISENLKQIILKNKFSAIDNWNDGFSDEYFFSQSNLKERFFLEWENLFTLDEKFFTKYEIKDDFSWIKKFLLDWRKIFVYNKKIFINSVWKEFSYQAVIPSNIPEKALSTFTFYFQIIIFLISFLSFFIYFFISRRILKPIIDSNEKIKKFSDNVWHEIMSPITVISWLWQLAEMWKKIDAKKILESTEKITNIIQTLKKISLLERENFEISEKNLWEILKNFLVNKKNSDSILKIEKWVIKKINEWIFYLILENLYSNAEKYKKKWTQIKIFLEKNKIIFENEIEKEISKEDLKKLKEKFFQADNSRKSKWTWLWLSIIDECLKILSWKISFFSEEKIFKAEIKF